MFSPHPAFSYCINSPALQSYALEVILFFNRYGSYIPPSLRLPMLTIASFSLLAFKNHERLSTLLRNLQLAVDNNEQLLICCRNNHGYALAVKHSQIIFHIRDKCHCSRPPSRNRRGQNNYLDGGMSTNLP